MRVGRIFRAVLIALAISVPPACADGQAPVTLKVATRIVPPFVMKTGTNLSGFTIELADAVAAEAGLKFDYFDADTLPALLDAVASGKADLGAAAISITAARAEKFDFSMPIFAAGLQIMTRAGGSETDSIIPSFVAFFTSRPFYELIGALLLLVLVPAPVIWFLERRHAHGSVASAKKRHEIFNSMYWSASTLVGQSAGHPVSWSGRLIAVAWMLVGVTFISYFTASITTALTVHQLQSSIAGLEDLRGKRVATVEGSSSQDYLAARDIAAKRPARCRPSAGGAGRGQGGRGRL